MGARCQDRQMRVATWCIGGVCGYLEVLCHWLERRCPDVVALQKIKVTEERFPAEALARVGYRSNALRRQSLFGVALLSRQDLPSAKILNRGLREATTAGNPRHWVLGPLPEPVFGPGPQLWLQSPASAHDEAATGPWKREHRGFRGLRARRSRVPGPGRRAGWQDLACQRAGDRGPC